MRILPRADICVAIVALGVLVAGSPAEAFAQERGPSASATLRASVTILDPVVVEGPTAPNALGAPALQSPIPVSVRRTVHEGPGTRASFRNATGKAVLGEDRPSDRRVVYTVAVIA